MSAPEPKPKQSNADVDAPSPASIERAHRASLAAMRSATVLRFAKAALLLAVAGILVFAVAFPLCADRPRRWFGMEFGPALPDEAQLSWLEEQSNASRARRDEANDTLVAFEGFERKLGRIDERIRRLERRCLIEGRRVTIARDASPVESAAPTRVALLEVEPTASNEIGAITSFQERRIYADGLENPCVLLEGIPADATRLRFQFHWIGLDGATLGRAACVFTRIADRWEQLVQSVKCSDVEGDGERLANLRVRIE